MSDNPNRKVVQCPFCSKSIVHEHGKPPTFCEHCFQHLPPETRAQFVKSAGSSHSTEPSAVGQSREIVEASNQVSSLMKRYGDAYLVSRLTDGFGKLIKGIGIAAAIVLGLVGLFMFAAGRAGESMFGLLAIFFAVFVGILFYFLGVLVSAQGQILKASLDTAVNSSPFLENEHRAKIMSLPSP